MQTNINSIFANLMQVRGDFVYFLFPDLWISLIWVIRKHFRMLRDVIPSHQRDRPQIFMRVTNLITFLDGQLSKYQYLYRIYNFFVNIIFILLLKVFSWWQLDRMQCYYSISLRNVFPNLTHILASLSLCFLSLSPNSRRPLGVKQIVFWYLTVILPTERVRQCYWEK